MIPPLLKDDIFLIHDYIQQVYPDKNLMDTNEWLKHWYSSKEYLYHLLGDRLTIRSPITIKKTKEQLVEEIKNSECFESIQSFYNRARPLLEAMLRASEKNDAPYVYTFTNSLFNVDAAALVKNEFGFDRKFYLQNDTTLQFTEKEKVFKALKTILKTLDIPQDEVKMWENVLEKARIDHSRILNNKELRGTLVISIHPMDYLTMSDNSYGWTSCLRWHEYPKKYKYNKGEYTAGTIEMMNSPSVVVAYIEGDKEWHPVDDNRTWSNKLWRELFIVRPDIIAPVKGYPYEYPELEEIILNKLRDAGAPGPWQLIPAFPRQFTFVAGLMYNDIGNHNIRHQKFCYADNILGRTINYSGVCNCIQCGAEKQELEQSALCLNCSDFVYCYDCGCVVDGFEAIKVDSMVYCSDCYAAIYGEEV